MSENANSGKSKSSKNNSLTNEAEHIKQNAPDGMSQDTAKGG